MSKQKKRDFSTSIYKKVIGLSVSHYKFIEKTRHKKSRAGRLNSIINWYKEYGPDSKHFKREEKRRKREESQRKLREDEDPKKNPPLAI